MTLKNFMSSAAMALLALVMAGCGGSGGGVPAVSSMSATTVSYGRTMTVTVFGTELADSAIDMIVEGPCGPVSRVGAGIDLQQQFTCKVSGLGPLIPRIRTPNNVELASLRLSVPTPQVSMAVTQGSRSGTYVVELDPVAAPASVDNFLAYVNAGFYRNTLFHRVISNFVVQAGGYIAGPSEKAPTLPAIVLESNNGLKNLRGSIAMARTEAFNSATAQFYINLVDNSDLDYFSAEKPGYAVFGKVVSGLDIVDEIGKVPTVVQSTALLNLPASNVVITAASQTR
jgi:peptidyl-prolyl cis-trans isomerase A (cyclophilin A)